MANSSTEINPQVNKTLTNHLKQIYTTQVEMRRNESETNSQIVIQTTNSLINSMKQIDPLFKCLYQQPVYTGSYWDGLRVKSPTEFDLNIVLNFKLFKADDVQIIRRDEIAGFVQYQLKKDAKIILAEKKKKLSIYPKLTTLFDNKEVLLRSKFHSWIQGLITKAKDSNFFKNNKPTNITITKAMRSGPAFTYYITTNEGIEIAVDLVPVILGNCPIPDKITKSADFNALNPQHQKSWFLVPKPYTGREKDNSDTYWRISFPEAEKRLIPDRACFKKLIKLFKLLRDKQKWDKIASYYIKELFLLQLDNDESTNPKIWKEKKFGKLFIMMLRKFQTALEEKKLTNFLNKDANLFDGIKPQTLFNYARRVRKIRENVTASPNSILNYFK